MHSRNKMNCTVQFTEQRVMLDGDDGAPESVASDQVLTSGNVPFPGPFIFADNGTIPASTVVARNAAGELLTGEGVGIGVISDSFNLFNLLDEDIANGELPEVNILTEGETGIDEGRAMAQILHDIAPGAELTFHTGNTPVDQLDQDLLDETRRRGGPVANLRIAAAYDALIANGESDIIVDDFFDRFAPVYQRSFEAQAQERAFEAGIAVFQSAGNLAGNAVEVDFTGEEGSFVDFDPTREGIQGLPVRYEPGDSIAVVAHWDDPYQSISPNGELTADFDLIFLPTGTTFDEDGFIDSDVVESPRLTNFGSRFEGSFGGQLAREGEIIGRDPVESFNATSDFSVEGEWHVQLDIGDGENRKVRVTFFDRNAPEFISGPTTGSTSENANAVGAVRANIDIITPETSRGRNRLLFDDDGNRLPESEQIVIRPRFLAPDGINNTFLGADDAGFVSGIEDGEQVIFPGFEEFVDPDTFPNFVGTSAAAPATAAVAALMLEVDPTLTPNDITKILRDTADGRPPLEFSGAGLINAQAAIEEVERRLAGGDPREAGDDFRQRRSDQGNAAEADARNAGQANRPVQRDANRDAARLAEQNEATEEQDADAPATTA